MNTILLKSQITATLLLAAWTVGFAGPPKPPPVGDISGIVTEIDSLTPIADAAIIATDNYGFSYYGSTDSNGFYLLQWLQLGLYDVEASKDGYQTQTQEDIEVLMDQVTVVDFRLHHACDYIVGDVNNSGMLNGIDIVYAVNYFKGFSPPPYSCFCDGHIWYVAGDVNGDCLFNGLDIGYIIIFLKGGSPPIPCPACPPGR